jgi:tetratricopeptide (TPR) repeat protein
MKGTLCNLFATSLLLCVPRLLFAQPAISDDAAAQSRLHFDRGVQSYKDGSLDSALAEFSRAYELTQDYRLLYNVAQVESERHEFVHAIETFTEYLKLGGSAIPEERRLEVETNILRLRSRVGELWVSVNAPTGEVWIGNHLAGKLPLKVPILVNAGPSVVRISSPGYKQVTRELQIVGGDRPRLELKLESERQTTTATTAAAPKLVRDDTWFWLSLTATAALATGSVVAGVLANQANHSLDERMNNFPSNEPDIDDARTKVRTDALVCDVLAGAAFVGAGLSFYFLLNPKYERAASPKSETALQSPTARLYASPTGLTLRGSF